MGKDKNKPFRYGLIGKNISYSFSKGYFTEKFKTLGMEDYSYENFDLEQIKDFEQLLSKEKNTKGFNVTIPYKEAILPYLSIIDDEAKEIGAVNTIQFTKDGLKGFNTDAYGFKNSLKPLLKTHHENALILGTGGASKAVLFVLHQLDIETTLVSRKPTAKQLSYHDLDKTTLEKNTLIINCTPLGTYPNIDEKANIPYAYLGKKHLLFDLIYNPNKTAFLLEGEQRGATIKNGLQMLELQAEKAWEIWTTNSFSE